MFSIINSFELVALSFSGSLVATLLGMMYERAEERKNEEKEILKFPRRAWQSFESLQTDPRIRLSFHFLRYFFPDARKSKNEKSALILYAFLFR